MRTLRVLERPHRSIWWLVAVVVVFVYACGSAPPMAPVPPPQPSLTSLTHYRLSGVVTDITSGSPVANVTIRLDGSGRNTGRSNSSGEYLIEFDAFPSLTGSSGLIMAEPGANSGYWTNLQGLSWSSPEMVKNLRLRPRRTIAAGQSMTLAIESDSSLKWDQEWDPWMFVSYNVLWEEFLVSVPTDGVLTINARPDGDTVPTLWCQYGGCPSFLVQGSVSIPVHAGTLYFHVEIPRVSAPQRFDVQTSLR